MNLLKRNIVALFDEEFANECIILSNQINAVVPSSIILNTTNMIPHMTIYTTNFPAKNEKKVLGVLSELAENISQFSVIFSKPVIDMLGVWINAEITPGIQNTHEKIVDGLNNLREGLYDEKELIGIGDNKKRKQSLLTYGMWAAKDLYIPHVTLSRPVDKDRLEEALSVLPKSIYYKTGIKEIAFVERGQYGTCKKVLEKFKLKQS